MNNVTADSNGTSSSARDRNKFSNKYSLSKIKREGFEMESLNSSREEFDDDQGNQVLIEG